MSVMNTICARIRGARPTVQPRLHAVREGMCAAGAGGAQILTAIERGCAAGSRTAGGSGVGGHEAGLEGAR